MEKQNDLLLDSSILYRNTQKYYDLMLQDLHLTYAQLPILIQIYESEGISMQQIAKDGGYDKGTVTKNVQKLYSLGYVDIVSNERDKRSKSIFTTSLAKKHMSKIYGIRQDWWHHITQELDSEQLAYFSRYYQTLADHARSFSSLTKNNLPIYDFKPLSLSCFDDHLACCIYTGGCNFKCPGCTVSNLVYLQENGVPYAYDTIKDFIDKRCKLLDGIYISGGEPLMHSGIIAFLKYARLLGYKLKLHTNGTFYERLKMILDEHLVDEIELEIKNSKEVYDSSCGLKDIDLESIDASLNLLRASNIKTIVTCTLIDEFHTAESIESMGQWLCGIKHIELYNYKKSKHVIRNDLHPIADIKMNEFKKILEKYIDEVKIGGDE